jgi:hypothetical protein
MPTIMRRMTDNTVVAAMSSMRVKPEISRKGRKGRKDRKGGI